MKLSQVQDLGGCRAILSNLDAVNRLHDFYQIDLCEASAHGKCYDYIKNPKSDGYRSIHIVGRYSARTNTRETWNGQRIEIQLRSQLQHFFATAVETVTTFTRWPLKFGSGPPEWRRFFALMGSVLAMREGTTLVPGTPDSLNETVRELGDLSAGLGVHYKLRGWTHAIKELPRKTIKGFKWLLLVLDTTANTIRAAGFQNRRDADKKIAEIEKSKQSNLDAVLVWVNSIKDLKAAYPNYYADTGGFIEVLDSALKEGK